MRGTRYICSQEFADRDYSHIDSHISSVSARKSDSREVTLANGAVCILCLEIGNLLFAKMRKWIGAK